MMMPHSKMTARLQSSVLVLLAVVFTQSAFAQQVTSDSQRAVDRQAALTDRAEPNSAASAKRPKTDPGGITVHGHWIIDVRNPDGKVVEHREFENALTGYGKTILASLLLSNAVVGDYVLGFGSAGTPAPQVCGPTTTLCYLVTSSSSVGGSFCQQTAGNSCAPGLTVTPVIGKVGGSPALTGLTLAGQTTAVNAGKISDVLTKLVTCSTANGAVSSAACLAENYSSPGTTYTNFTVTDMGSNPVTVIAGQAISISVTITFS